jgi:hypothetical protein
MSSMTNSIATDGLDALRQEIGIREIAQLIERTARWVAPETFRLLPAWYPEHARRRPFYKANWSEPQMNKSRRTGVSVHKVEGNVFANQALTLALGLRKADRPNWSCCHLWGVDDPTFQQANDVDSFQETNRRGWRSETHATGDGRMVLTLTHPGRAEWRNPDADPTCLVRRALAECRR